jgi:pimeloyl-ACP methyl ester carboxylesterase
MNTVSLQPHFVDVSGATLEVFTGGSGPTTVCFAQYRGDSGLTAAGTEFTQALQADHQIILVNARGSGHSSPSGKAPWSGLATDLEQVRQHVGVEQRVLSAYTNGVVSSLLYAIDHPERIAALIVGFFGSTSKVSVAAQLSGKTLGHASAATSYVM